MENFNKDQTKIIAFDVDGTLFSSENVILDTYIESIQNFRIKSGKLIKVPTKEQIIEQVGLPVKQIFRNLLPEITEEERDSISDSVLILLCNKISEKKGKLFDQVLETIHQLHASKYILCIASNGRAPYINAILETYNLKKYFQDLFVINYETIKSKGDILRAYLDKFQESGQNMVMVGDRKSDLDAAKNVSCYFAYCEFGHADPGEIETYTFSLTSIQDLLDFL